MSRIITHRYSIEEAFRECFYVVPDYQREYVWTEKEVNQLLEDINEQIDTNSEQEYFIGTILVSPTKENTHYEIIDGQQRLTTLFLLLCVLRHLLQNEPKMQAHITNLLKTTYTDKQGDIKNVLKLEPRYENGEKIINTLIERNSDPQSARTEIQSLGIGSFGSLENLLNAYTTLYNHIRENYETSEKLKSYWTYLSNNVVFIQVSTNVSSALKIFETINERGIGLNPMDLLKNLLFSHVEQVQFNLLKDEWKKITKPLEQQKEKPLRFLRYFLMANYPIKGARGGAVVREDGIYDWLTEENNAALCGYPQDPFGFVQKIADNANHYINLVNGLGNDGKTSPVMHNLKRLTGESFSLHYVLLLAAVSLPKNLFEHFVVQLECFLFYYLFTKTTTKNLEALFSQWADELRHIAAESSTEKQKEQLNEFIITRFNKSITEKTQDLTEALQRLSLGSIPQYRIRYFLARLAQYADYPNSRIRMLGSIEPYSKLSIEYILPNHPSIGQIKRWRAGNPDADYNEYKNRLGNLTLMESPYKAVPDDDYYAAKSEAYRNSDYYLTRSLIELTPSNRILRPFPGWDSRAIEKRQDMYTRLALETWKITLI